jgi:DNA-binding transcriptional MerR regulator
MPTGRDQEAGLLTPPAAAKYLGVSLRTLQSWHERGIAPKSIKYPSGARRYRKADLDAYIAEHEEDG